MNQQNKTFEENMQRLEQIVRVMERGEASLEDSLKLFQEGTALVQSCGKMIDDDQLLVEKVMTDASGQPLMEEFSDEQN